MSTQAFHHRNTPSPLPPSFLSTFPDLPRQASVNQNCPLPVAPTPPPACLSIPTSVPLTPPPPSAGWPGIAKYVPPGIPSHTEIPPPYCPLLPVHLPPSPSAGIRQPTLPSPCRPLTTASMPLHPHFCTLNPSPPSSLPVPISTCPIPVTIENMLLERVMRST